MKKKLVLSAGLEPAPSRSRNPALFQPSYESVLPFFAKASKGATRKSWEARQREAGWSCGRDSNPRVLALQARP